MAERPVPDTKNPVLDFRDQDGKEDLILAESEIKELGTELDSKLARLAMNCIRTKELTR